MTQQDRDAGSAAHPSPASGCSAPSCADPESSHSRHFINPLGPKDVERVMSRLDKGKMGLTQAGGRLRKAAFKVLLQGLCSASPSIALDTAFRVLGLRDAAWSLRRVPKRAIDEPQDPESAALRETIRDTLDREYGNREE